jgi:hypothetical protein
MKNERLTAEIKGTVAMMKYSKYVFIFALGGEKSLRSLRALR